MTLPQPTLREIDARIAALNLMIGNTPMLAVDLTFDGDPFTIYTKMEAMNMTGSVKDRMALHVLRRAHQSGQLVPGGRIIEATSGNTGISFAAIGRALGHPVTIFMPDWMSSERVNLIRSFGADIRLVSHEEGGFLGSIAMAEDLAGRTPDAFLPRQFSNAANVEAHELSTGPEIWAQMVGSGLAVDAFVAGVGTGGTVMGVGRHLRSRDPNVRIHPLEPSNSPTLSTGHKVGKHRIQGISDEFIPAIVDLSFLSPVVAVDDGDAILMAQALASQLGFAVGISSGANVLGAVLVSRDIGPGAHVVTVFSDSNKKYLSTDLMKDEAPRTEHLTPRVALLGFRALGRHCAFCHPSGRLA